VDHSTPNWFSEAGQPNDVAGSASEELHHKSNHSVRAVRQKLTPKAAVHVCTQSGNQHQCFQLWQ